MASELRRLQAEWNDLVPLARERGVPRVRMLNAPLETIAYRKGKLEWLKSILQDTVSVSTLTFGIELECIMPPGMTRDDLAAQLTLAGVVTSAEVYGHRLATYWKVITDGSLGDYVRGVELVSPVLKGDAGLEQVRQVCRFLTEKKCKVNLKCGLHVHVGAREEGVEFFKNLVHLYAAAEPVIDTFMAPSRRASANSYCKSVRPDLFSLNAATNLDAVARSIGQTPGPSAVRGPGRYSKLNLMSFWQHGTVEFRQHQGTVDQNKAVNWIKFCLRMALAARKGTTLANPSFDDLMKGIEATTVESDFFKGRVAFFTRRAA